MDNTRPLGAQISHMLKARGVDVIFGIPGVHNIEMYRGIEEAGIAHILARHEQGAGFMADGYARASGRPGVAYVITGPGLCNIMTPMGQAWSDSVPLLVISSGLDEVAATRGQLHQMRDQTGAGAAVCDWSLQAGSPEAAYQLIDRALSEFQTSRARPKHVQVAIGLLGQNADPAPGRDAGNLWSRPAPDPRAADMIAGALKEAKHPLMILGGGAVGAAVACESIATKIGAGVFCTYAARGVMPADHPLYFGATLPRAGSKSILERADLVLVVGSELAQVDLWRSDLGHDCKMIRIDLDPENLSQTTRVDDQMILGDAGAIMSAVDDTLQGRRDDTGWNPGDITAFRAAARAEADSERPGIVPLCDLLRDCLPDDVMIYSDMTQFAYTAKEVWDMPRPGHWHHPTGFGTLGYGLPAAIGGAVARPGLPTIVIAGDYGFQYTVQELGTAVELGLSLPIILWDNGKLKEIEDAMVASQIAPNSVVAHNPDFCALARAYGALAEEPKGEQALRDAVERALSAPVPTLIRLTPQTLAG